MLKRFFNLPVKIGSDHFGNKYYEKITKEGKISRWVIQKDKSNPADYDAELIPASWKSWLSQTRKDPPNEK